MKLPSSMKATLDKVPLAALDFASEDEIKETAIEGKEAISKHIGQFGSVSLSSVVPVSFFHSLLSCHLKR